MNEDEFWIIIRRVHESAQGNMNEKCEAIKGEISRLEPAEAESFYFIFDAQVDRAYSWGLWGAAYVIHGGCGDDTFSDFRASLISRGQETFERALSDPDCLADEPFDEDAWFYEGFQYAVSEGVHAVVGKALKSRKPFPKEPSGAEWDEDDLEALYPRLHEKFP